MNIEYMRPLSQGWGRMIQVLFRPFDLLKWFVLGFTAFLAQLTDGPNGGGREGWNGGREEFEDFEEFLDYPHIAWEWLLGHPGWFTLIVIGLLALIMVVVLLIWLSSRGKFMFLDNVVHNRDKVTQPWYEFRTLGNSLFTWRLCFGVIVMAAFLGLIVLCYFTLADLNGHGFPTRMTVLSVGGMVLAALALILITAYIALFLDHFVVPLMYKYKVGVGAAWGRFLSLFTSHWLHFVWYGIIVLFIYIVFMTVVVMVGLLTCFVGFILLVIPYIGSVITLPISYTLRAFSLEFLVQFGPGFSVFHEPEPVPIETPVD